MTAFQDYAGTWTDKWNIQRKRWAAPFRSWKDVTRSVSSTRHRTPHIRGCWHFKSGLILEIETLFFYIFLQILCFKCLRLGGKRTNVLISTAIMELDFWRKCCYRRCRQLLHASKGFRFKRTSCSRRLMLKLYTLFMVRAILIKTTFYKP